MTGCPDEMNNDPLSLVPDLNTLNAQVREIILSAK